MKQVGNQALIILFDLTTSGVYSQIMITNYGYELFVHGLFHDCVLINADEEFN